MIFKCSINDWVEAFKLKNICVCEHIKTVHGDELSKINTMYTATCYTLIDENKTHWCKCNDFKPMSQLQFIEMVNKLK